MATNDTSAAALFRRFLADLDIAYVDAPTIAALVEKNFVHFNDVLLRKLIDAALKDRTTNMTNGVADEHVLGEWGEIMDAVRDTTLKRRDACEENFKRLASLGNDQGPEEATKEIGRLFRAGMIDYLFKEILKDTIEMCKKHRATDNQKMFEYFDSVVVKLEDRAKALRQQIQAAKKAAPEPVPAVAPTPATVAAAAAAPPAPPATVVSSPASAPAPAPAAAASVSKPSPAAAPVLAAAPAPLVSAVATVPVGGSSSSSSGRKGQAAVDSDDELIESAIENDDIDDDGPRTGTIRGPHDDNGEDEDDDGDDEEDEEEDDGEEDGMTREEEEADMQRLIDAGVLLDNTIKESRGDVAVLKLKLQSLFDAGCLDLAFLRVLEDNLLACQTAGYVNKTKLLQLIKTMIAGFERTHSEAVAEMGQALSAEEKSALGGDGSSTHHAPKFVDGVKAGGAKEVSAPTAFIEPPPGALGAFLKDSAGGSNAKKKSHKRVVKKKAGELAEKLGKHLETHAWAVCDNFLPLDLVRRVRIEAGLFTAHYEQSEIWVGKEADVGAQLSVPSVRGDKVLWMCGAHTAAPEGISRVVKTKGEIEPCRLEVKAKAPLRRFTALKELIQATDKLMEELKPRVERLKGVYERSDAMLAVYPGGGARFANHIDNTTGDGRRLTVLLYLNPGWTPAMGGALRVTEPFSGQQIDILPQAGRLAMFYSESVAHEVLPTFGDRHAITVWYYDRTERGAALDRAKEAGRSAEVAQAGTAAQAEAKAFIGQLMGGDEVGADGGQPTDTELRALAARVRAMDDAATGIVASITGAKDVATFRQGFELLTTDDLRSMRQLFRRMGLQE